MQPLNDLFYINHEDILSVSYIFCAAEDSILGPCVVVSTVLGPIL